ncbi:alpha/beta fold hydrolase [Thiolinea disciformis]|uniref:alpha/beta fold hydrolase n=1 Tax=Thiolinea disciformis TaxID=125614 RepID=UPI000372F3E3|nr:alpha/beta fold hydrolase [Thiolinea disciformis]
MSVNPEIAHSIQAAGILTNYHDVGSGEPVLLIHGSGPGVSAWANWRLTMPSLAEAFRVIAPDMAGFGFSERPENYTYNMDNWVTQALGLLDALGIQRASVVGNSFGGALALALAIRHPDRVNKLVLMGSVGVPFTITEGLDRVWGYQPSLEAMKALLDIFAYSRELVNDELANLRYQASIRPGFQESFSAMFPAPRQRWVDAMASKLEDIRALPHQTLIIHGREDQVIPLQNAYDLLGLIQRAELHVFGQCGHWTQIEYAPAFNMLVKHFLLRE